VLSETGTVTAGLALTLCLSWAFMPTNQVWNGVLFVYTRANANAVLVALNSRSGPAEGERGDSHSTGVQLSAISYPRGGEMSMHESVIPKNGVLIHTETSKDYPL
jgi:hypothetical protein